MLLRLDRLYTGDPDLNGDLARLRSADDQAVTWRYKKLQWKHSRNENDMNGEALARKRPTLSTKSFVFAVESCRFAVINTVTVHTYVGLLLSALDVVHL